MHPDESLFTKEEITLAKELFAKNKAAGTLSKSPGLGVLALRSSRPLSDKRVVYWQDYLPQARRMLSKRK